MPNGSPDETELSENFSSTDSVEGTTRTAEEVEAIWKNRVSQKDKAHAAEAKALRDEAALLKARLDRLEQDRQRTTEAELTEADRWKQRAEELEQAVQRERAQALLDKRRIQYGFAAEMLDDATIAGMDEGKLAALNARLSDEADANEGSPSRLDPNAPRRNITPPKSSSEKSVAELKSDLRKFAPEFASRLG